MSELPDDRSLADALRDLQLAHYLGASASDPDISAALDWVLSRRIESTGYGPYFEATPADRRRRRPHPTGEPPARSCVDLPLGTEAARILWLFGRLEGWPAERIVDAVRDKGRASWPPPRLGYLCCPDCTVARWRLMSTVRRPGWDDVVAAGLRKLATVPLGDDGRWVKWPFAYTVLALSELPPDLTTAERHRVARAARAALKSLSGDTAAVAIQRRALACAAG